MVSCGWYCPRFLGAQLVFPNSCYDGERYLTLRGSGTAISENPSSCASRSIPSYDLSFHSSTLLSLINSPIHDRHSDSLHPLVTRVAIPRQHHHLSGIPGFVNRLDQSQIPACQDFAHADTSFSVRDVSRLLRAPPYLLSALHISNSSHHQLSNTGARPHELGMLDDWFGISLLTTPPREGSSMVS